MIKINKLKYKADESGCKKYIFAKAFFAKLQFLHSGFSASSNYLFFGTI